METTRVISAILIILGIVGAFVGIFMIVVMSFRNDWMGTFWGAMVVLASIAFIAAGIVVFLLDLWMMP